MICISCSKEHQENFCPNCGEKSGVKRITMSSIVEDVISSITNMDRGLLSNLKTLSLGPKKLANDYVRGKRKGILNPISYLILSITVYLIVINLLKTPTSPMEPPVETKNQLGKVAYELGKFIRTYIKYFWILAIIPLGLSLRIVFKKYNYLEHMAISAFIIGHATFIGLISFMLFKWALILDPIVYIVIFWLIYKIFKDNTDKFSSIVLAAASMVIFIVQLILLLITMGLLRM